MRFFDHKKHNKAKSSHYEKNVVLFPGNHFQALPKAVKALEHDLELRDAQQFKNSVAALIQSKNTPRPSVGLFSLPKSKPRAPRLDSKFEKDIKPSF